MIARISMSSFLTALLRGAQYFIALALVLTTCLTAVSVFHDFRGAEIDIPVSFDVDARALHVTAPALGVEAAQIQNVRGSLSFPPTNRLSIVGPLTLVIIMLALVLWGLGQLHAVFRTLRDGQPFVPENAGRIRKIAFVVICGEFVRSTAVFFANSYAVAYFSANGLRFDAQPDLNFLAIIHGLIILAIAEVFRAGTRLDEDQSLTI